jgi:sec-independent protein translocase protein TatB
MPDILFILLLALVIFGPKKLPEIARLVGKLMLQFRQMSNELKSQLESEMLKIELEERRKKLPETFSSQGSVPATEVAALPHPPLAMDEVVETPTAS